MPRAAVAVADSSKPSQRGRPTPDIGLQDQLSSLGRQMGHGRRLRPGRSQFALIGLLILGVWLFLVFGRALTQLNAADDRQAALAGETATLELRLEAARRELVVAQTDGFQALEARALGLGESGEQVFALASNAPQAPAIVPLGGADPDARQDRPLDAWLTLLLGD